MGTIKLTNYGSSLREPVKINGFVLTPTYYQADDIHLLDVVSDLTSSDLYFEETDCQGNVYSDGSGRIRVRDDSDSEYVAYSMLLYTNYESTKKIVAVFTSDHHDYVISKNSDAINKFITLDLSVFQYGVSFSSYISGSRIATPNNDGLLHIDDHNTSIDDSYSVYSKTQVDSLISNLSTSLEIPTNISAFNNDVGYISQIKTINNQSLIGTGDITITSGGSSDYATYIGNNAENYVAYSNNVSSNGKALLPYADATDRTGYVDLGSPTNRWRNAYINETISFSDGNAYIGGYSNVLRLLVSNALASWTSVTTDITDNHFYVYSCTGSSAVDHTEHTLIYASSNGISLYDNYVNITSTETTFNKDIGLVLAKDTNTYINDETLHFADSLMIDYEFSVDQSIIGLNIRFDDNNSWSKFIPLSELDTIIPIGELVYTYDDNTGYNSCTINQTDVAVSLKTMLEQGYPDPGQVGLYVVGTIDHPTALGIYCGMYTDYGDNALLFVIPVNEFSLNVYNYSPGSREYTVFYNGDSTYSISNDYTRCRLSLSNKISIKEYVVNTSTEVANNIINNFNFDTSDYCTLSTDQYISGNKTFYSNVYIQTNTSSKLYVTGYTDDSGIRFGDSTDSVSYPMIVGETMSSTRCDLRQNYYVNNTLAGTIQTQCDSDGNLITTSGLGRSSSTTGKWSLGTSDYHLNEVHADSFYGDLQGNATTANDAFNAENIGILGMATPGNYPLVFTNSVNSDMTPAVNQKLYTDLINSLSYNPNTATLTCETFYGDLSGNATTADDATNAEYIGILGNSTSSSYPLVFTNSVNSSTTSAVNKNLYTDTVNSLYYNPSTNLLSGLFAIPYGSASLSGSTWTVSSPSPNPTTSTDPPSGAIVSVYFSSYNSAENPQLKVGSWNAKPLYRTSSYAGTGAANSWPAGSVVLLRYNGSNWRLLNNNSYPTSTASGTTNIIPSTDNTYDLGSTSYRWNNLYSYYVGDSSTKIQYGYFNYCSISTLRNGSNSNLATLTTAGIIPATDSTSSTTGFDLGSSSYKWKNLYVSGGHSSNYIVIDNNGSEPTIRPDANNYGYLGSSSYHWYRSYINTLYLGSNAVQIPPISAKSNTTLGSIQFLRVAIPQNTTTGIVNAGTVLSSSTYTLMLVTASTGATYLSFRNNTAPSGSWTTLTDMYYYNSTTSVVYTYVLAYKSA